MDRRRTRNAPTRPLVLIAEGHKDTRVNGRANGTESSRSFGSRVFLTSSQ